MDIASVYDAVHGIRSSTAQLTAVFNSTLNVVNTLFVLAMLSAYARNVQGYIESSRPIRISKPPAADGIPYCIFDRFRG